MTSGTFTGNSFVLWNFPGASLPLENQTLAFNNFFLKKAPQWVCTLAWACDTVRWHVSADTLCDSCQLTITWMSIRLSTIKLNTDCICLGQLATVSVKIVGTLCRLRALPMLVVKIWWVNCDKQHWEDEETGQKWKTVLGGSVPTIFVWDCS